MNSIFDFFFKGNFFIKVLTFIYTLLLSWVINYKTADIDLYNQIVKMDSIYFTAYNTCDMKTQADIFHNDEV